MNSVEAFLAELIGPDTRIALGEGEATVSIAEFAELTALVADLRDVVAPPRRDSFEYREAIAYVAELDELDRVMGALDLLHDDYGWRGPADVMTEWVLQMDRHPLTQSSRWRDMTGVVDLTQVVVIRADEEQRLRIAADKKELYEAQGLPPHEAFQKGLAQTEAGIALCERWMPYFHAALRAAHTTGDRRAVLGELFRAPGRTDRTELIKGASVLGTAAYGIRHHHSMTARFEEVAAGREATHDPSIAPGWDTSGGYMTRSALRRKR